MGHPAIEAEIAVWTDETVIALAQKCRVQMDSNGKLIREFHALHAAGRITGENPYLDIYNTACECYRGLRDIMQDRGINPANPQPRPCPKEGLHNEDYG